MIFPGMDPYLENLQVWPDVHASFIVYLREHLRPLLRPRYVIAVESRVFVEGPTTETAKIPGDFETAKFRGATRWSKGNVRFRVDREVMMNLATQFSMRVQVPPSRCRSESVSPRPATGPQRSEAGINGGI